MAKSTGSKKAAPAKKAAAKKAAVRDEEEDVKPAKGKAVARIEKPAGALVASGYAEDAGAGFEDMGANELAIPFIGIVQKGSPAADEDDAAYVEGAEPGNIINSVTKELWDGDEGIRFIPVHRVHNFIEWVPRDEGGGFVGVHEPNDPMVVNARNGGAFGKLESPAGNDLVETFSVYGLLVNDDDEAEPCIISFSSTQIKHYKKWMTQLRGIMLRDDEGRRFTPPMFAHVFRLTTRGEQNKKGKWHGWHIRFDGENADEARLEPDSELYRTAKQFREAVTGGMVRAAYESTSGAADTPMTDPDEDDDKF